MNHAEILNSRVTMRSVTVAEGTTHERIEQRGLHCHPHNAWPDQMVVLGIEQPPITPAQYFNLGRKIGAAQVRKWTSCSSMPREVIDRLEPVPNPLRDMRDVSYLWTMPGNAGTSELDTLDVIAIIEPQVFVYGEQPGEVHSPALVVRLGHHRHEIVERKLGNCYYEYTCTGCKLTYRIDSSDLCREENPMTINQHHPEPLSLNDMMHIVDAFLVRKGRFQKDDATALMTVLANAGDGRTNVRCIAGEWTGTKKQLPPSNGVPMCPNGHVLLEGDVRWRLGYIPS